MQNIIINKYKEIIELSGHDGRTKAIKIKTINSYMDFLAGKQVAIESTSIKHLNEFLALAFEHLSPDTFNHRLSIFKHLYRWLHDSKIVDVDWGDFLVAKKVPQTLPRNIPSHLMEQICTPAANEFPLSYGDCRDQAIIEFLYATGVRSCELIDTQLKHLSTDLSECFVNSRKNGVPRYVFLGTPAQRALSDYLTNRGINITARHSLHKKDLNQPLFCKKQNKPLDYEDVRGAVKKLSIQRGHTAITPHMIRHTFATEFLRASGNIRALQLLLGHKNIDSTMKYCHLDTQDKIEAIEKHHPLSREKFDK